MILIDKSISQESLTSIAKNRFGNLIKAVIDVKKEILVIDADLHADEEAFLLKSGSQQSDLWGINLYPELHNSDFIEFDSMINIRPGQNTSRGVDNSDIQNKIRTIISKLIT